MRTNSQNLLGLIASDIGQKLHHLVEILFVAGTVIFLVGVAMKEYEDQVARAEISEALNLVSTVRIDLVAYRAEYGRWPVDAAQTGNTTLAPQDGVGKFVSTLALGDEGTIDVVMGQDQTISALSGKLLSLRLSVSASDLGAPIILTCGGAKPPPGMFASGIDKTSISPEHLPYVCKEH